MVWPEQGKIPSRYVTVQTLYNSLHSLCVWARKYHADVVATVRMHSAVTAHCRRTLASSCVEWAANRSVVAKATANPTSEACPSARDTGKGSLWRKRRVNVAGIREMPATIPLRCSPMLYVNCSTLTQICQLTSDRMPQHVSRLAYQPCKTQHRERT